MIKRNDTGTVGENLARVIADDVAGELPLAIEIIYNSGTVSVSLRKANGTKRGCDPFIPSKPWDSLKPTEACFVRDFDDGAWLPRVFARVVDGKPETFAERNITVPWNYCVPAEFIGGELVPVEDG